MPLSWFEETASFHGDIFRRGGWYHALVLDLDHPFVQGFVIGFY